MRDLLSSILLLSFIKFIFDEARQHRFVIRGVHSLFYVSVIVLAHFRAQYMSLPKVESILNDVTTLQNIALIVMLDLLLTVYISTTNKGSISSRLRNIFLSRVPLGTSDTEKLPYTSPSIWDRIRVYTRVISLYLPSLLFIPGLFYLRLLLFYVFPGNSFTLVTLLLIGIIITLALLAPYLTTPFIGNNYDTLCQASIYCSFFLFIVVVVAGVLIPSSRIVNNTSTLPNFYELGALLVIVIIGALSGYIISLFKKL